MPTDDTLDARFQHLREQLEARDSQNEEAIKSVAQALEEFRQKGLQDLGQIRGEVALLFRLFLVHALEIAYLRADLQGFKAEQFRLFWHEPYEQVTAAVRAYSKTLWETYLRARNTIFSGETPLDQAFQALSAFEQQINDLQGAANIWGLTRT